MTEKRCTDCKHTKGIGYDFWCGEGHTEYEVFGAETNCPYYEYYDWSKGTPSKTEKRFRVFKFPDVDKFGVSDDIAEVTVAFCDKKWEADSLCDLLNDLNDENEYIKNTIKEAYHNERTQLGKSVLKQLMETIQ